ncbi:twin-arginine translocation signal domain-containing protein, partial [Streptomyces sp. SID7760]|nr:twin-arginine translocation signal domain-containing protein [Streptomyces sp. SID7760]
MTPASFSSPLSRRRLLGAVGAAGAAGAAGLLG